MAESPSFIARGARIADRLADSELEFRIEIEPLQRWTLLDTFECRLQERGLQLWSQTVEGVCCLTLQNGREVASATVDEPPQFARDLPRDVLGERVTKLIDVRRLIEVVDVRHAVIRLELDWTEHESVALRIVRGEGRVPGSSNDWVPLHDLLTIDTTSDVEHSAVVGWLTERLGLEQVDWTIYDALMHAVGDELSTSAPNPDPIDPNAAVIEGATATLAHWFAALIQNEDGVRADLDSEFLHDFRVAVRRTRSLLGQLTTVFDADLLRHFRREFKWLGRITGPCRDADVFAIDLERHEREFVDVNFALVYEFLEAEKAAKHKAMCAALDSKRYARLVADWREFLDVAPHRHRGDDNRVSFRTMMTRCVRRSFKRVVKRANKVTPKSSASKLHGVRIACKELRYAIGAASPAFEAKTRRKVLRRLKRLQDILGEFNDCHVQVERIYAVGLQMDAEGSCPPALLIDLGRLAQQLNARADALRAQYFDAIGGLCNERGRARFKALLDG